jgi:hypothetical protein
MAKDGTSRLACQLPTSKSANQSSRWLSPRVTAALITLAAAAINLLRAFVDFLHRR